MRAVIVQSPASLPTEALEVRYIRALPLHPLEVLALAGLASSAIPPQVAPGVQASHR
jgi:hypothetical protein